MPLSVETAAESHALQREKAKERRLARPNGEMIVEAKKHWELVRQHNISKEERQKHVNNLMENVQGKVKDVVTKHDASRFIQAVSTLLMLLQSLFEQNQTVTFL